MEKYCIYNAYDKEHNIVKWLFEILKEFDENLKSKFLFFLLGFLLKYLKLIKCYFFRMLYNADWWI